MPARESSKEDEGEKGENNGDDEEVREDDGVFEGTCDPDDVERVLIDRHAVRKRRCVVRADP